MAGRSAVQERWPDLPGLPSGLSVDQLARVERFLGARDVRRPYNDHLADFFGPPGGGGANPLAGEDVILRSGEVITVSGHRAHAVLVMEAAPPFGHWDTVFLLPILAESRPEAPVKRWEPVAQSDGAFATAVASLKGRRPYEDLEPFPFAYRYFEPSTWAEDPHVDATTGWSANGRQIMDEVVRRVLGDDPRPPSGGGREPLERS